MGVWALGLMVGCDAGPSVDTPPIASSLSSPRGDASAQPSRPTKPGVQPLIEDEAVTKTWPAHTVKPGDPPIAVRVLRAGDLVMLWGWGTMPGAKMVGVDLSYYDDEGVEKAVDWAMVPLAEAVEGRWYRIYSVGDFRPGSKATDRVRVTLAKIFGEEGGKLKEIWVAPDRPKG
jgi:hypothetical protein